MCIQWCVATLFNKYDKSCVFVKLSEFDLITDTSLGTKFFLPTIRQY